MMRVDERVVVRWNVNVSRVDDMIAVLVMGW